MPVKKLIAIKEFCSYHEVDMDLLLQFESHQLISLVKEKRSFYLPQGQLPLAEKLLRLHLQLGINLEGLEVILPLLHRIQNQDAALRNLQNQLNFYENRP